MQCSLYRWEQLAFEKNKFKLWWWGGVSRTQVMFVYVYLTNGNSDRAVHPCNFSAHSTELMQNSTQLLANR